MKLLYSGFFDLLHAGHVMALENVKNSGDCLVVHVASDAEAKAVKGELRPVIPGKERVEMVRALKCVDEVIYREEYLSFEELLDLVKPDVVIRNQGGNLEGDEEKLCVERGIEFRYVERFIPESGLDTTKIINKVLSIGEDPKKLVGINYVLRNGSDVLLQKRDNKVGILSPGAWCFPGGAIEEREDALLAAVREIKEETGVEVHPSKLQFLTDIKYPWGDFNRVFVCDVSDKTVLSKEGKMEWKPLLEVKRMELAANQAEIVPLLWKVPFWNSGLIYKSNRKKFLGEIDRVLKTGKLIGAGSTYSPSVNEFEERLASFVGTTYAVALNSGTDALYLALWAKGIGPGDEVLVPSHTFVATAQVVHQLGATPVLYDMDGELTFTEKTKAIIPAHITGSFGANMSLLMSETEKRGVFVIEDACQALGAVQGEKKAGAYGLAGAFSFYPAKILGCFGDGGALVTDDRELYEKVKELRNHYKGDTTKWGVNSRMDNIQAVVLNIRIKHLPEILERRKEIAERYLVELKGIEELELPKNTEGRVWQDFVVRTERRDELFEFLGFHGIETLKNEYPMPIGKLPLAEKYERETLRIPCNDVLTDEEVSYVIKKIKNFFV